MLTTARRLEIAPKARKTTEGVGRCVEHAYEMLGFSSAWGLVAFIDELARRSPGQKRNVRLPSWKTPEGVRAVIAVRCRQCMGRGCSAPACSMFGWGVVMKVSVRKRESKCAHEVPPARPASTVTATPNASSAPQVAPAHASTYE
jgi:hypothetical protein